MDAMSWVQVLIPVLVPLAIAVLKKMVSRIPGWLLPILAPLLGGIVDAIAAYASGGTANPVLSMALGSAGVGLREVVDQARKAQGMGHRAQGQGTGLGVGCVLLCALCAVPLSGCSSLSLTAGHDLLSGIHQFTRDDAQAALEMAQGAGDEVAARCYAGLIAVMDAEAKIQAPQVKGALSAFQRARGIVEHKTLSAVSEQINLACAPLVVDVGTTLGRFGVLAAPGGGILGKLLP